MAFDFGAALSSAGDVGPAYQKAQSNIKDEKELAAERVRKAQEFTSLQKERAANTTAREQQNKQWVPMRDYTAADGSSHTVYFTPEGLKDLVNAPDPMAEREQMLKSHPELGKGLSAEQLDEWKLTGKVTTATRPLTSKPPALDWVDQNDGKGNWFKVGYSKDTHEKVTALPETKVGFGITPVETTTWNPMVGEWVQSYRMPSPSNSFDGTSPTGARPGAPPPGSSPRTPPGSVPSTLHQLAQPPAPAGANAPPRIFRYDPQNPTIKGMGDTVANVMQQFVGTGNDPLWSYADLFDDPKARQAINKALTMSMNAPPTISEHPGLGESIAGSIGLTGFLQNRINTQIQEARADAVKAGGPRALELVDRLAELKGAVPGLRAFSKSSAALGAIAPLIQESPALNTMSSRDFRIRSALVLKTLAGSIQGDPSINPQYVQWMFSQAADAMKGQSAPSGAAKTAAEYLQRNQ